MLMILDREEDFSDGCAGKILFLFKNAVSCNIRSISCSGSGLRANGRFLGFARKMQSSVTVKWAILGICP